MLSRFRARENLFILRKKFLQKYISSKSDSACGVKTESFSFKHIYCHDKACVLFFSNVTYSAQKTIPPLYKPKTQWSPRYNFIFIFNFLDYFNYRSYFPFAFSTAEHPYCHSFPSSWATKSAKIRARKTMNSATIYLQKN